MIRDQKSGIRDQRRGSLFLIPVPVAEGAVEDVLPAGTLRVVRALDLFFAESPKSARAFLKAAAVPRAIQTIEIHPFDGETRDDALDALLAPVRAGRDAGVLSEAGAPGVADPGARLVRRAHAAAIRVAPCVGPSSILLALMASGLDGQRFGFHGYLPIEAPSLAARLRALEAQSLRERATQAFIETPYRNDRLVAMLLETLAPETLLAIACDIGAPGESIATRSIREWRTAPPALGKRPAVFALLARAARGKG